jgi:hypothetical protein
MGNFPFKDFLGRLTVHSEVDKLKSKRDYLISRVTELYLEYDSKIKTMLNQQPNELTLPLAEELYSSLNAKVLLLENDFKKALVDYMIKKNLK